MMWNTVSVANANQSYGISNIRKKRVKMEQIQFTKGCPVQCQYCYEPEKMEYLDPEIPEDTEVQIMDMNFLRNPKHLEILNGLPKKKYEFVCGIDFRVLTQEIADLMKQKGFSLIVLLIVVLVIALLAGGGLSFLGNDEGQKAPLNTGIETIKEVEDFVEMLENQFEQQVEEVNLDN